MAAGSLVIRVVDMNSTSLLLGVGRKACRRAPTLMSTTQDRSSTHFAFKIPKGYVDEQLNTIKACSVWQWFNYCSKSVPANRRLLRVNLDGTPICFFQGAGKGNVFLPQNHRARQNVKAGDCRKYCTHLAFICDDMSIQKVLPQILIANEHSMTNHQLLALRRLCPPHVRILRRRSAWVDAQVLTLILIWLADALVPYLSAVQPVLLLDAYRVHYAPMVIETCTRRRLWLIITPARLTWLLQPLDTHAFLPYKMLLHRAYQQARINCVDGTVGLAGLVASVLTAITDVLERRAWAVAFDHNGFGNNQARVSDRVTSWLQMARPVRIPDDRPSLDQLRSAFPRRVRVAVLNILRPLDATLRDRSSPGRAGTPVGLTAGAASASSSCGGMAAAPIGRPLFHRRMRGLDRFPSDCSDDE